MENMVVARYWKDRNVFVTGGTGFVGSWLIKELLSLGAHITVLIRDADPQSELFRSGDINKVKVISGCIENFFTLERAINEYEIDTVFHLAAQPLVGVALRYPVSTFETNIRGTYNLLEACRTHVKFVKKIVIASSDKAYGAQPELPYVEEMPLQGQSPYEVSKSCADLLAQSYYASYELPIGIARCGNIYGGGDLNWSRIVPGTIRSFLRNEHPIIRSDGHYIRDYIYVKDICRAYLRLAEHLEDTRIKGQAFNFSAESAISVIELVNNIQQIMSCQHLTPLIENQVQNEIHSQYLSAKKALRLLDWQSQSTLHSGLTETIKWYQSYLEINNPVI